MSDPKGISIKKITAQRRARLAKVGAALVGDGLDKTKSLTRITTEGYAEDVAQIVRCVTEKTATHLSQITDQSFQLIMSRFDRLEEQNTEQSRLMAEHKLVDDKVHDMVKKHENHWNIVKWAAGPTGVGAGLAAWFGFHK